LRYLKATMSQDGKYEESRRHCDDLDPQNWPPIDVGANFLVQHIDFSVCRQCWLTQRKRKSPNKQIEEVCCGVICLKETQGLSAREKLMYFDPVDDFMGNCENVSENHPQ